MTADDWRRRLESLVAEGLLESADVVRSALREELDRLPATPRPSVLEVDVPVLGVDASRTCWVGVVLSPDRPPVVLAAATLAALVELAREAADLAVVAVDTSIGPPDVGVRQADVEVIEVQPELSFARMGGALILESKKDPDGIRVRRAVLEGAGLYAPAWYRGSDFGEDDLLDACAAAWTAVRYARREAEALPAQPEVFTDGLPAAIWV